MTDLLVIVYAAVAAFTLHMLQDPKDSTVAPWQIVGAAFWPFAWLSFGTWCLWYHFYGQYYDALQVLSGGEAIYGLPDDPR